jgi:hypothetical protein
MTKYFHIVQVHPVEKGEPNTYKVVLEKEFESMHHADEFIRVFNSNHMPDRHGNETIAVYLGCVNDETGELV